MSDSGWVGVSPRPPSGRRWPWAVTAAALVVAGSTGAWATAANLAGDRARREEEHWTEVAAAVVAGLQATVDASGDLASHAAAWAGDHPLATAEQLTGWISSRRLAEHHPQVIGLAIVPVAGDSVIADVSDVPAPSRIAAGDSSEAAVAHRCAVDRSVVFDRCALRELLATWALEIADGDAETGLAVRTGEGRWALTATAIYRDTAVAETPTARRRMFAGLVVLAVDQEQMVASATRTNPNVAARLAHREGISETVFESGDRDGLPETTIRSLGRGWSVQIFSARPTPAIAGSADAMSLLIAGLGISLLAALLLYTLGTDRSRALRLVGAQIDELRHQALHDALTGLPNRALIVDRLEQLIVRSRRHGTIAAALYLDVDGFKNINETLGHAAGDELLIALGARFGATLRNVDTIGRMGADEFVVLLDGASFEVAPALVAERLLEVTRQPFQLRASDKPLHVTISIGVVIGDCDSAGEFLRDADVARYQAKAAGRNRYEIFHPEMQSTIRRRVELEFDLRSALVNGEFNLVYQPIYNLDDLQLLGAEALLRWEHPVLGKVKPETFIPILEQTGQIVEVGQWVLSEACREVATWQSEGCRPGVSVNVSGRQFDDDTVVAHVREALEASGLLPSSLTIEMTESAIMRNHTATARRLRAIKHLGVKLAIDDFGTGYSSFAYLREFPIDSLKIDRSFTNAITRSTETQALIRTLVQLGRDLGMKTVAEGVETIEEMDCLRLEQVDEAQGFLLARPLSPQTFRETILRVAIAN